MKIYHIYYVYILECSDGSYYTGMTGSLDKRLHEHHTGYFPKCYTYKRRALLRFSESYQFVYDAIAREKQIKGWNRKKKEALIEGYFDGLEELSKRRSNDTD
jgi:putative endonuclease